MLRMISGINICERSTVRISLETYPNTSRSSRRLIGRWESRTNKARIPNTIIYSTGYVKHCFKLILIVSASYCITVIHYLLSTTACACAPIFRSSQNSSLRIRICYVYRRRILLHSTNTLRRQLAYQWSQRIYVSADSLTEWLLTRCNLSTFYALNSLITTMVIAQINISAQVRTSYNENVTCSRTTLVSTYKYNVTRSQTALITCVKSCKAHSGYVTAVICRLIRITYLIKHPCHKSVTCNKSFFRIYSTLCTKQSPVNAGINGCISVREAHVTSKSSNFLARIYKSLLETCLCQCKSILCSKCHIACNL